MFKIIVLAQALLIQVITSQCVCNGLNVPNWAGIVNPIRPCETSNLGSFGASPAYHCNQGLGGTAADLHTLSASSNCVLPIRSYSPITPGSLSITSENVIEGPVSVYGELPFLSAVAFEASMPTAGYGTVAYNCGNGNVGILSETLSEEASGITSGFGGSSGLNPSGFGGSASGFGGISSGLRPSCFGGSSGIQSGLVGSGYSAVRGCGCKK